MERNGYDRRTSKRPFVELPSEHRLKTSEYLDGDLRVHNNHFQHQQQPLQHPMKSNLGLTPSKIDYDYREYTTPVQEYRSPRTPDTPYIGGGSRYTPYDVPTPYHQSSKSTLDDHRLLRPRYTASAAREVISEPLDRRITPKVSWQYDIPAHETSNQICEKYERPMDPKEFKEQCRKAYLQNAQDRKRNAELSVWGKCDWASFEKCHDRHRR